MQCTSLGTLDSDELSLAPIWPLFEVIPYYLPHFQSFMSGGGMILESHLDSTYPSQLCFIFQISLYFQWNLEFWNMCTYSYILSHNVFLYISSSWVHLCHLCSLQQPMVIQCPQGTIPQRIIQGLGCLLVSMFNFSIKDILGPTLPAHSLSHQPWHWLEVHPTSLLILGI